MTIKDSFKELQSELSKINTRHDSVIEEQRKVYLQYHTLISEREELMDIGESDKAKSLDHTIKSLRSQVDKFEKEITDLSPERIREAIKKHPNSKLHEMAISIQG